MEIDKNAIIELEKYDKVRKKVNAIKAFYLHLIPYLIVNLFLMTINLMYSPKYLWFLWPLLGWGISVLLHGLLAFEVTPFFNKDWEQRKINQFIEEEKNKQTKYE